MWTLALTVVVIVVVLFFAGLIGGIIWIGIVFGLSRAIAAVLLLFLVAVLIFKP